MAGDDKCDVIADGHGEPPGRMPGRYVRQGCLTLQGRRSRKRTTEIGLTAEHGKCDVIADSLAGPPGRMPGLYVRQGCLTLRGRRRTEA